MEEIAKVMEEQLGFRVTGRSSVKVEQCRCESCDQEFEGEVSTFPIRRRVVGPDGYTYAEDVKVYRPARCPKCEAEHRRAEREEKQRRSWEENLEARIRLSRIPLASRDDQRIETFKRLSGKAGAHARALAYVQKEPPEHHFLTFVGETGRGKTHLALAIGWYFLENTDMVVRFYQAQDLIDDLKAGFHVKGVPDQGEDFDRMLAAVKNCGLLIIDDLGAEQSTDWAGTTFDAIINYRYARHYRTVFTSNTAADKLPPRISSRIQEGVVCVVEGIDYRLLKGKVLQEDGDLR